MKKYHLIGKCLTISVILLFVGTCIIPSNAHDTEKPSQSTSRGNWLYVGGNGPGNYTRIQDAINDSQDGDTVFVYDDSSPYYEILIVNTSIDLIGENKDTTIIDGGVGEYVDVVSIVSDWVTISGFTIQNSSIYCVGIELYSCYNTISGNIITHNDDGIRMMKNSAYNNVTGNTISNNSYDGIGLYGDDNIIADNIIISNRKDGIESVGDHNTILENKITNHTFALDLRDSNVYIIIGNTISSNSWSGIEIQNSSNTVISDNIISHSSYGIRGYSSFSHNVIRDNIITLNEHESIGIGSDSNYNIISDNELSKNGGGIILDWYANYNNLSGNTIKWNLGEGIELQDSNFNTIRGNRIGRNNGSGIDVMLDSNNNSITDNIIYSNRYGLLLAVRCGNNTICGNTISNNTGGICLIISTNNTISRNNFVYNKLNAVFFVSDKNIWKQNFWNRPRFLPKVIFGIRIQVHSGMQIPCPGIDIDLHPAKEPYNIPGMS